MAAPIVTQPGVSLQSVTGQDQNGASISSPICTPNCSPGLNYLKAIDELLVYQYVDIGEVLTSDVEPNSYKIKSTLGEHLYSAKEDTTYRKWFGCFALQKFDLKIFDKQTNMILSFSYPLRCRPCCYNKCLQEMKVSDSTGDVLGYIVEGFSLSSPKLSIKSQNRETILKIVGPSCPIATCCSAAVFKILNTDGKQIGQISKTWSGVMKEAFTNADNFNITFPADLDVHTKATLLGALFLIDYMYFESPPCNLLGGCDDNDDDSTSGTIMKAILC